jgi:hypothetical protein
MSATMLPKMVQHLPVVELLLLLECKVPQAVPLRTALSVERDLAFNQYR